MVVISYHQIGVTQKFIIAKQTKFFEVKRKMKTCNQGIDHLEDKKPGLKNGDFVLSRKILFKSISSI
ncbi:MAG: hypothetical protein CL609_15310 [Anaerolineaceae bacterium]|nr:hypothetical protein [Anaerolineaceae bacterium]